MPEVVSGKLVEQMKAARSVVANRLYRPVQPVNSCFSLYYPVEWGQEVECVSSVLCDIAKQRGRLLNKIACINPAIMKAIVSNDEAFYYQSGIGVSDMKLEGHLKALTIESFLEDMCNTDTVPEDVLKRLFDFVVYKKQAIYCVHDKPKKYGNDRSQKHK